MSGRLPARALRRILDHAATALIERSDVVGVTTGLRRRGGAETDEECITVFVKRKLAQSRLSSRRRIPGFLCGRRRDGSVDRTVRVYTDVVQMKPGRSLAGPPGRGGDGLFLQGRAGTQTLAFRRGGDVLLLSNRHVLAPRLHGAGDRSVRLDSAPEAPVVADTTTFIPLVDEGGSRFRDAALAFVRPAHRARFESQSVRSGDDVLPILGMRTIRNRETRPFRLSGFRSRLRSGFLWDRLGGGGSWTVEYPFLGTRIVEGVYGLRTRTRQGDSGSPIYALDPDGVTLVGIAIAVAVDDESGDQITLFHSIVDVEKRLREVIGDGGFTLLDS